MNLDTQYPCRQTVRLSAHLDDALEAAAYDRHLSKAQYIRNAIRQSLGRDHERPARANSKNEVAARGS